MKAVQDLMPRNHCYGCGPDNPDGLQIKSYWQDDVCVCTYTPRPEQCAGPLQYLYGGTLASLIDCHSVGTAVANYYRLEGREIGEEPEIWCVTGQLSVNYLEPTPIDRDVTLRASIKECTERKTIVKCRAYSGDTLVAAAKVIAIRVPASWKE